MCLSPGVKSPDSAAITTAESLLPCTRRVSLSPSSLCRVMMDRGYTLLLHSNIRPAVSRVRRYITDELPALNE